MNMEWFRIQASEVDDVMAMDEDDFYPWCDERPSDSKLSVDKEWHGIHVALTGSGLLMDGMTDPLAQVVAGGDDLDFDGGYGPPRVLEPTNVTAIATALDGLSDDTVASNIANADFGDVYPYFGRTDDMEIEPYVDAVRRFFRAAADAGDAIVISLT
jgi:hypothetical protein